MAESQGKIKIQPEKQYEYLTTQLRYLDDKIFRSFTLFIKLATAIIGATFYLDQSILLPNRALFALATNGVFVGVGLGCILLISNNLRSWQEHRKTLVMRYQGIPPLEGVGWGLSEVVTCIGIAISIVGFLFINPLNKSYPCAWIYRASLASLLASLVAGSIPFFVSRGRAL